MRAALVASLVTCVIGCGAGASTDYGHDASTGVDGQVFADATQPDAAATFSVQYTDPDHGPFTGGTVTTIRGTGFESGDTVTIGGRAATALMLLDPRHVEVTTPLGDPGAQTIVVTHASGESASAAGAFTYQAISLAPSAGSTAGGTFVTISGLGTDFDDQTVVTFDGVPASAVTVSGAQHLTCITPPNASGSATVVVVTSSSTYRADDGYEYDATGDPYNGGLGGGPIAGTLNITVIDAYTDNGVPDAFVAIGDPNTTPWKGTTDMLGQITFSDPSLVGPVSVVVAPDGYEVGTFDCFDATNLSIFVDPLIPPTGQGPPGVGTSLGKIEGSIEFGDATELGSTEWDLVPEPTTPTQVKRVYVTSAGQSVFDGPPLATDHIDYHYDANTVSWPFSIPASPGAIAVVAVAGIYDSSQDPSGMGETGFTPYAIGVARGVLVGPDQTVGGVDIVIDTPLDAAMRVDLVDPPPLSTDASGPLALVVQAVVDLGGDGAIEFGAHGLGPTPGGDWPGTFTLPAGATGVTLEDAPTLEREISDGAYTFLAGAFTNGGQPMSARVLRDVTDIAAPIEISGFVGIPRFVDPPLGGTASGRVATFAPDHETQAPTFHLHYLTDQQGNPVWRGVSCGAETSVQFPDLSSIGRVWPPPDTQLYWTVWSILSTTDDYNQFTYRWEGQQYWTAYATETGLVQWPQP